MFHVNQASARIQRMCLQTCWAEVRLRAYSPFCSLDCISTVEIKEKMKKNAVLILLFNPVEKLYLAA